MAKKNAQRAIEPGVMQPGASSPITVLGSVHAPMAIDASLPPVSVAVVHSCTDEQLHALLKECLSEVKLRREAARNLLPPLGAIVKVRTGKWEGKKGEVVALGKTRCHVSVQGFPLPAYVLISDVEVVSDADAA